MLIVAWLSLNKLLLYKYTITGDELTTHKDMASVERLDEFDPKFARWTTYKLRLESWLRANKVTQAQAKPDCFIAIVGCKTVELLVSLCTPEPITDKSYEDLIAALDGYFDSSVNSANESVIFDMQMQQEHESGNK